MKKLLLKFLLIFLLIILIFSLAIILPPNNIIKNTNIFALPEKNTLLQKTIAPRIIFIGGSNLSFGLNSQMIKDSLKINPINTGIHAGIGLEFLLSNYLNYIKENDVVVLSPEYQQFYGDIAEGDITLLVILIDILHNTKDCNNMQIFGLLKYVPKYASAKLKFWQYFEKVDTNQIGTVDRKSFNCYGDAYIHWSLAKPKMVPIYDAKGKFNVKLVKLLIGFKEKLLKKNVKLFITFPCYQSESYDATLTQIKEVERVLIENKFTLLSSPERYKMDDSIIFDTPYHLTKKGVNYRTTLLIEDLKKVINK